MKTQINFVKYRFIAIAFSIIFFLVGVAFLVLNGMNLGIDFVGGISYQVKIHSENVDLSNIRNTIVQAGYGNNVVQIGDKEAQRYIIRMPVGTDAENDANIKALTETLYSTYGKSNVELLGNDLIGPTMSKQFIKESWVLILVVFALILIYVFIRFKDIRYSIGAIVALIHDVALTMALFLIFHKEFTLTILAALLTLIGYSLNDTIVVFSRIRENKELYPKMDLGELINKAINETLSRTIITSMTTFIVVFSIFLFGGEVLKDFGLALSFGIIIGTYSSIFIASPMLILSSKAAKK